MSDRCPVAYWLNSYGEECSSRVRATFTDNEGHTRLVVWNWRRCDYEVICESDCITVRHEPSTTAHLG